MTSLPPWKCFFVTAIVLLGWVLFRIPPSVRPTMGARGAERTRAIERSAAFAVFEPVLRQIASWVGAAGVRLPRGHIQQKLLRAGDFLGLSSEEAVALSLCCSVAGGVAGWLTSRWMHGSAIWAVSGLAIGSALPFLRMADAERTREREVTRGLPGAIDLLWLCMSAGLDFPAALRFVTGDEGTFGILRNELRGVLREVELGHTRVEALRSLETRLPFHAIRGFVAAVTQSEERGNPLADVLRVQAQVLRARRGVLAEEAAARASVLLVIPLMLLLGCVLLLLFGPFLVQGWMT